MKELDEDMLYKLQQMNEQTEATNELAAIVTNRDTIIISDKIWICEWSINNIVDRDDCPELDEMFSRRDEVFLRLDEIKTTPWAKLLFPDKDNYYSCDEADPDDEDAVHDTVSFIDSEGARTSYNRHHVETFYSICEDPEFEIYPLSAITSALIVYDNGRRIGGVMSYTKPPV